LRLGGRGGCPSIEPLSAFLKVPMNFGCPFSPSKMRIKALVAYYRTKKRGKLS